MYDFHDSTDTLKFWTEKRAINNTVTYGLLGMGLAEILDNKVHLLANISDISCIDIQFCLKPCQHVIRSLLDKFYESPIRLFWEMQNLAQHELCPTSEESHWKSLCSISFFRNHLQMGQKI